MAQGDICKMLRQLNSRNFSRWVKQKLVLDEATDDLQTLTTMELLYFIATCLVRLSIAAFLPRLSKESE